MKILNKEEYLKQLEEINVMLLLQCNYVKEMFESFQNNLLSIIDDNALIITLSKKESELRQKLCLTKDILECIRIKTQLYKK